MRALQSAFLWLAAFVSGSSAIAAVPDNDVISLDDLGTRLKFSFYTADVAALQRDLERLAAHDVSRELALLRAVYTAFGEWKQAELLHEPDPAAAARAARKCVESLELVVAQEARAALLAMLSRCQHRIADIEGRVKAPLAAGRSRQNLERALKLAPKDPRVLLVAGLHEYEQRGASMQALEPARDRLEAAVAAFAGERLAGADTDLFTNALDWGEAEAWMTLGRVQWQLGDAAAARDALEHALVLVEDYQEARLLLEQVTNLRAP